jgi:hypothetical protein
MMLELTESKDFTNHPPIVDGLDMLEQHTIVGGGPDE